MTTPSYPQENDIKDDESFEIKRLADLEEKARKAHEEFFLRKRPEFNLGTFVDLWQENQDLKEKILLSHKETEEQQINKQLNYRLYLDKIKEMDRIKKGYEKKVDDLNNTIKELNYHAQELAEELKVAQDKLAKLEVQNDDPILPTTA